MKEWVTVKAAAERMDRHPGTVRRMCERGELEGRKFGVEWRINARSLDVWRPSKPAVLTVPIPPEDLAEVRQIADAEGATAADVVRRAVRQMLADHPEVAV